MPQQSGECPPYAGQTFTNGPEDYVLAFIDGALDNITRELMQPDGRPSITLKRRSNQVAHFLNLHTGALEFEGSNIVSTYSWPGKNTQEAWHFSMAPELSGFESLTNENFSYYSQNPRTFVRSCSS